MVASNLAVPHYDNSVEIRAAVQAEQNFRFEAAAVATFC